MLRYMYSSKYHRWLMLMSKNVFCSKTIFRALHLWMLQTDLKIVYMSMVAFLTNVKILTCIKYLLLLMEIPILYITL